MTAASPLPPSGCASGDPAYEPAATAAHPGGAGRGRPGRLRLRPDPAGGAEPVVGRKQRGDEHSPRRGARRGSPASSGCNPEGHGPIAVRDAQAQGRADEAAALAPLAEQPAATWFANPGDPFVAVEQLSLAAAESGQLPVLVAYYVPNRDCGSYSSGGATDIDAYLSWVGSFAAALADRPAVVVLEPDAVAQAVDGCAGLDPAARYELLTQAVQILDRQPETRIYLDAGNPEWIPDLPALSDALRRSGIAQADGFALNVSNFQTTEDSAAFGLALSEQLEREGFPASTSSSTPAATGPARPGRRRPGALVQPAGPAPGRGTDDVPRAPARRRPAVDQAAR